MAVFVALLRAVNVGGTGALPMDELRAICERAGFEGVTTYIASGNVVFRSSLPAAKARRRLEVALAKRVGRPVTAMLRTPAELEALLARNPFPRAAPNRLLVLFLDVAPPQGALEEVKIPGREEIRLAGREVFIHYPDGMGRSNMRMPLAAVGTGRNVNTVRKLLELARRAED